MKNFFHIESEGEESAGGFIIEVEFRYEKRERHFSTFSGARKMRNKLLWINALFRIQEHINRRTSAGHFRSRWKLVSCANELIYVKLNLRLEFIVHRQECEL